MNIIFAITPRDIILLILVLSGVIYIGYLYIQSWRETKKFWEDKDNDKGNTQT